MPPPPTLFLKMAKISSSTSSTPAARRKNVLNSLLKQLRDEGKLAFPPLLASYLSVSPEMEDILQLWSQVREDSGDRVANIDRLILETLEVAVSQLTSRTDLGEAEGGDTFKLASPLPLARAIIHRHTAILRDYLNTSLTWVYPLVFKLLTTISKVSINVAKETLTLLNIPDTTLDKILTYVPTPVSEEAMDDEEEDLNLIKHREIRCAYLEFCASFLEATDLTTRASFLSQGIFARLTKGLHLDELPTLTRHLDLVTLLAQPQAKLTWGSLLSLIDLPLLNKCIALLKTASSEGSENSLVFNFLIEVCTHPGTGICFRDGGWYPRERRGEDRRPVNGVLSSFLMTLRPTESLQHQTLVLGILKASPALASLYWSSCQLSLEPRLSTRWLSNMVLLQRTIELPVPSLVAPHGAAHATPSFTNIVDAILPEAFDRAMQSKCFLNQIQLVRYFGSLVLLAAFTKLDDVLGALEAHLRENMQGVNAIHGNKWETLAKEVSLEAKRRICDFRSIIALHKTTNPEDLLMSQLVPRLLKAYQRHVPDLVLQSGVSLDKLMPINLHDCHPAAQARALELLLHLPDIKWWGNAQGPSPALSLIQVYVQGVHFSLQDLACRGLHQFLGPSLLFQHDPSELSVWMNVFSTLLPVSPELGLILDRALSLAMASPYKYIDATLNMACPTLEWISRDQTLEARLLPFSPLLLALKDAIASEEGEVVAPSTMLLTRLTLDLACHSSSPGVVYTFLQACESESPRFTSGLQAARRHIGSLLGISDSLAAYPLSGAFMEGALHWEESQTLNELDKVINSALDSQFGDIFIAMLQLSARFPNLLQTIRCKFVHLCSKGGIVFNKHVLCGIESKNLDPSLLLSRLPPNLLITAIHPDSIGHPFIASLLMTSACHGDQGMAFLARAILCKLQAGLWGCQVEVESSFVLIKEMIASNSAVLPAVLNHPLLSYSFLHPNQFANEAFFLRRLNFSLSHLLANLPMDVTSHIPQAFITKITSATQDFIHLAQHTPSVSGIAPMLMDLVTILPIDALKVLASLCLADSKAAFSSLRLAQLTQTLLAALSASPEGAVTSGNMVASHLDVLSETWLLHPTLLLDNALVQALGLIVPHTKLLLEPSANISHSYTIHASLVAKSLTSSTLEKVLSALFGPEAYIHLSAERLRMSLYLVAAKKSLRLHFCRLILASPNVLQQSLHNPLLSSEMLSLMTTLMSIHQLTPSPQSQDAAEMMADAALSPVLEAFLSSSSEPTNSLQTTLLNLSPSGWGSFVTLMSDRSTLTTRHADALSLGLEASSNPYIAKLTVLSYELVLQLDTVPRQLCGSLAKLLAHLSKGKGDNTKLQRIALLTTQMALRSQDVDALDHMRDAFSNLGIDSEFGAEVVEITLSALQGLEIDPSSKIRTIGIKILYLVFKAFPKAVSSEANLERLAAIYTARYTRQDRQLLEMLVHVEALGQGSVRRSGLLWGGHRARFSSWEVQDMLFKGTIVQESILTLEPSVMRETIGCMPLPGLSFDPATPLVDPPEFQENGSCYDPAFILALFKQWLAFGSHMEMIQFVRRHNLGLLLTCLSSPDAALRKVSYHLLDEVYLQAETSRFVERHQLLVLLQVLKNVIEDRSSTPPPLPCVLTQFAAAASSIVINPVHPLYNHVNYFIVESPLLSLRLLPMFVNCFVSFSKGSRQDRVWLLKILSKGLKLPGDFPLYSRCHAFTSLMSYYHSPSPDAKDASDHQLPILELFFHAARQPHFAATLVGELGGLNFLQSIACSKAWDLGPLLALRLGYQLILSADMQNLSWKLPCWPQVLLTLAHDSLDDPVYGVAGAEAALRVCSLVVSVSVANPSVDLHLLKSLIGATLAKACFALSSSEAHMREFEPSSPGGGEASTCHGGFRTFSELTHVPVELKHFNQLYLQATLFGLQVLGQLPAKLPLPIPAEISTRFSSTSHLWKFLVSRALALRGGSNLASDNSALTWVLDLP
ncbi:hypothetical protein DSO57_1002565 [Entomophthora muscae]|uniref:Uncharacterized protein n=1 Tax=Entomophthora muscae TaxID=34485 RepID=A0ACC2T8L7_9FUNG|nr:hypothetical protein DSO57_1002565 [Entomophthora muscae]